MSYTLNLDSISTSRASISGVLKNYILQIPAGSYFCKEYSSLGSASAKDEYMTIMSIRVSDMIREALKKPTIHSDTSILIGLLKEMGIPNGKSLSNTEQLSILAPLFAEFLIIDCEGFESVQKMSRFDLSAMLVMRNEIHTSIAANYKHALSITSFVAEVFCEVVTTKYLSANNNVALIA